MTVRREVAGPVVTLYLDNGDRNVLTAALLGDLLDALTRCATDPAIRAVVLTGAGSTFSAGADLAAGPDAVRRILQEDGAGPGDYQEPAGRVSLRIWEMDKPVIAAVNGDAVGGGATITLAADVRFAADTARFAFPFTRLAVSPEGGSTWFLPRLVGPSRAADWMLSGRLVDAREALAAGLVSRLLPAGEVLAAAQAYAHDLAVRAAPSAVRVTRRLLAAGVTSREPGPCVAAETRAIIELAEQPEHREAVAAFFERRPPDFGTPDAAAPAE